MTDNGGRRTDVREPAAEADFEVSGVRFQVSEIEGQVSGDRWQVTEGKGFGIRKSEFKRMGHSA